LSVENQLLACRATRGTPPTLPWGIYPKVFHLPSPNLPLRVPYCIPYLPGVLYSSTVEGRGRVGGVT